ncbi:MAG TPA: amino acid adenylation domain-containing protein, partial [Candidatus Angelobacter sp.]
MNSVEHTDSLAEKKKRLAALLRAKTSRVKYFPVSHEQRRFWLMQQVDPEPFINQVAYGVHVAGDLDLEALNATLTEIIRRHEILRTNFVLQDGNLMQVVHPADRIQAPILDLAAVPAGNRERLLKQLRREEFETSLDLERARLIRIYVVRLAEQHHELLITLHHVLTEAFEGVLSTELQTLYAAYAGGRSSPLPELEIQYSDYAVWQQKYLQSPEIRSQIDYWRKQLVGVPALELPHDRRRTSKGKSPERGFLFEFSWLASQKIKEWSRSESTTVFATLLAGLHWLLGRYSGQEDFAIGTVVDGRREETEDLVGIFMNTVALRAYLGGRPSFRELLKRVQEVILDAFAHKDVPFEKVMEELASKGSQIDSDNAFQTGFVFQNPVAPPIQLHGLRVARGVALDIPFEFRLPIPSMNLLIELQEKVNGGLRGTLVFNPDLFVRDSMERLLRHYELLLERAVASPHVPLTELSLLGEDELKQILFEWNQTEWEYPRTQSIHAIFEEQAEQHAQEIAISLGTSRLTFGELNGKANQMAGFLRESGVGPEVRVGICLERSADAVIVIMAVLKAGGAYVPMDPGYPAERLRFMLQDAQLHVLLTRRSFKNQFEAANTVVVCMDEDLEKIAKHSSSNLQHRNTAENLAYIIYTSGSTGVPKGVLITHRGLCNTIYESIRQFRIPPRCSIAQIASLSFDASVVEILTALCAGARLCMIEPGTLASSALFANVLHKEAIHFIAGVPSLLNTLPADEEFPSLKKMVVGGEACTAETAARWSKGRVVFNVYAPTETTIFTTTYQCEEYSSLQSPPVGRPIANSRVYILDEELQPVPVGIGGEIYIGGIGVARGYWRRPELTAERFVPDAFSNQSGERLYRTGDRGRYQPDGNVEFLGRLDHQIKLRGYRIELGEIEAALCQHAGVEQAVVMVREDHNREKQLVG